MTAMDYPAPGPVLWREALPGGCHWSGVVRRGVALRLIDSEGGANVSMLIFNHEERAERYNMPDTLKAQHTAFLTRGNVLMTDMGRAICSVIDDTAGWHDTVCGVLDDRGLSAKYGERTYRQARNDMYRSGKEGLLKELARNGLGRRDLHANVNWFSKVVADEHGALRYVPEAAKAGSHVDLRFDMNAFVVLSAAPHPLDPKPAWSPPPVAVVAWRCGLAARDDACRLHRAENARAFENTERYFAN